MGDLKAGLGSPLGPDQLCKNIFADPCLVRGLWPSLARCSLCCGGFDAKLGPIHDPMQHGAS